MVAEMDQVCPHWGLDLKIELEWANMSKVTNIGNIGAEQGKAPTLAHILWSPVLVRLKLL